MPLKIRQLKVDLRKAGTYQVSQEGSHTKWKHPLVPSVTLILSGHDGEDAKPYQEKPYGVYSSRLQRLDGGWTRERNCSSVFDAY
jgi:predicted RNA binding protein YcfA (HicA-like mRNA interferase family)